MYWKIDRFFIEFDEFDDWEKAQQNLKKLLVYLR